MHDVGDRIRERTEVKPEYDDYLIIGAALVDPGCGHLQLTEPQYGDPFASFLNRGSLLGVQGLTVQNSGTDIEP